MQIGISDNHIFVTHPSEIVFSATRDKRSKSNEESPLVSESGQLNTYGNFRKVTATSEKFPLQGDLSATINSCYIIQGSDSGISSY